MFNVKHSTKKVGQTGEDIAADYLLKMGYKILFRNYRTKIGEIDIIVRKSGKLIFVEVKSLFNQNSGILNIDEINSGKNEFKPEYHLNLRKINKLRSLAQMFAGKHFDLIKDDIGYQIDLIAVTLFAGKQSPKIDHFENV